METPVAPVPLSGKQRRHLRALGHHLDPVVQIGKHGLSEGTLAAVGAALEQHELVKVRVGTECPEDADAIGAAIGASDLRAHLVQKMGRTLLVYRRHPKEPKIVLPK
ncbi:MAG TPA: ribosome assembly RNA-binding protein YhbY [Byssovorax sp.]|jgi:RNA-binding protein